MRRPYRLFGPPAAVLAAAVCLSLAAQEPRPLPPDPQPPAPQAPQAPAPPDPAAAPAEVTLELIMADPDWLGNPPEDPYWADDGQSVYYLQKRPGEEARDLVQVDLTGAKLRLWDLGERGAADAPGRRSPDGSLKVWEREGDLFVKELATGRVRQLTRTAAPEIGPTFSADGRRVIFERAGAVFVRELENGLELQPAELRLEEDPDAEAERDEDFLEAQQQRLIGFVRETEEEEAGARERERAARRRDPTRVPPPWYLGDDVEVRQASLSPAGRWLIVALGDKGEDLGRKDTMPSYVSASGYVETQEVRPKVGTGEPAGERLLLLDLETHESFPLATDALPGIQDDPLAPLREAAAKARSGAEGEAGDLEEEDLEPVDEPRPEERAVAAAEAVGEEVASRPGGETAGEADLEDGAQRQEEPRARRVSFAPLVWSDDGRRVAVRAFSLDNKDRWIAGVDFETRRLVPVHRLHDPAWVGYTFNDLGWLPDGDRLWYLSEESGFSQLYLADLAAAGAPQAAAEPAPGLQTPADGEAAARPAEGSPGEGREEGGATGTACAGAHRRLSAGGEHVVSEVQASRDGSYLYYQANVAHPGVYEVWRVGVASGVNEQVTDLGGVSSALLSPDDSRLLITHSRPARPPELYLQAAAPGAPAERLTSTVSREFERIDWTEPEIVAVPSSHVARPIYARLYLPEGAAAAPPGSLPAVFFTHGAGYLQNAHAGWSDYFREFLFHTFLTRHGYAVLDMDYRASAGYGRDWRTAIYRQMGKPELEDLADGVAWLTAHHPVDRERIGTYGGSYGGFLTLMALFTRPGLFACGAALRPVTDWAHYNHGYTSNILNTPRLDPEAYRRSSPIEFADGLEKPLLICAPMLDDNVFFQDTVRLAQRLIELGKEDWEVALYPVEPHSFRKPYSWLDEYRRIFKLFEENLKPRPCDGGVSSPSG